MDNPTVSLRRPAPAEAPRAPARWVSADALLRHLEADDAPPHTYTSLQALPDAPPPDPFAISRDARQRARRDRTPVTLPPRSSHGTWWAYDEHGCRCELCTDAAAITKRQARRRRRERREQERQQARERQGSAA